MPINLNKQGLDHKICHMLDLPNKAVTSYLAGKRSSIICAIPKGTVIVGIVVGNIYSIKTPYKSVFEALHHAAIANQVKIEIRRFESDKVLEKGEIEQVIDGCHGYLVPGGFGESGWMEKSWRQSIAEKKNSLLWPLPRHAGALCRVRTSCPWTQRG